MSADDLDDLYDEGVAPWDGRRVPMTLLGGYLGSGKTTLLNDLLRRTDRPIAVLVNDVGEINIDAALLKRRSGDTIELTDGCVCCSIKDSLGATLGEMRNREVPPDHVVLELSGVADPTQVLPWANSDGFRLDGVIVLADATSFLERLTDERTRPLVLRQLEPADLVIVSKSELVSADERAAVRAAVLAEVPDVTVVDDLDGSLGPTLLDLGTRRDHDATAIPPPSLLDPHVTEIVPLPRPTTGAALQALLADLPDDVVRAKGIAEGLDGERLLIQQVGRRRRVGPLPHAEDQEPTDLVVIRVARPEPTRVELGRSPV
ncbi:MAG: CobW family GTP-binding protein [Actinomycetota bacterium]